MTLNLTTNQCSCVPLVFQIVGQLGKLRAGCLPALAGRIANPPQAASLPHIRLQPKQLRLQSAQLPWVVGSPFYIHRNWSEA